MIDAMTAGMIEGALMDMIVVPTVNGSVGSGGIGMRHGVIITTIAATIVTGINVSLTACQPA